MKIDLLKYLISTNFSLPEMPFTLSVRITVLYFFTSLTLSLLPPPNHYSQSISFHLFFSPSLLHRNFIFPQRPSLDRRPVHNCKLKGNYTLLVKRMLPKKNWGTRKYGNPRSGRGEASGSRSNQLRALETDEGNSLPFVPLPRLTYEEWRGTQGEFWISSSDRLCVRIDDNHRRCFRQIVRAFIELYSMGKTTGRLTDVAIVLGSVILEVSDEPTIELKKELENFLKERLGERMPNPELQHLYMMIQLCTPDNCWMLQYHPILMSLQERYEFPSITRIGLKKYGESLWESEFDTFVRRTYGIKAKISIKKNIEDHRILRSVYDNNNNRPDSPTAFFDSYVGLSRYARALYIHGTERNKQDLSSEVIERELSNRFPFMLALKFQFLFQVLCTRDPNPLEFLAKNWPTVEDGVL